MLLKNTKNFEEVLSILIIGPYLLTSLLLYSGLFTDRSRELRETMEYLSSLNIVKNQTIKVDKSSIIIGKTQSKIIQISLLTPNLGEGVDNLEKISSKDLVWSTISAKEIDDKTSLEVVFDHKNLSPWKLIRKNQ